MGLVFATRNPTKAEVNILSALLSSFRDFGLMIDTARAEPVLIEKHGRGVVMVIAVEEYRRLSVQSGTHG